MVSAMGARKSEGTDAICAAAGLDVGRDDDFNPRPVRSDLSR